MHCCLHSAREMKSPLLLVVSQYIFLSSRHGRSARHAGSMERIPKVLHASSSEEEEEEEEEEEDACSPRAEALCGTISLAVRQALHEACDNMFPSPSTICTRARGISTVSVKNICEGLGEPYASAHAADAPGAQGSTRMSAKMPKYSERVASQGCCPALEPPTWRKRRK